MSFLRVDHNQASDQFEMIAEGEYEIVISDAVVTESKSGNPMLKLTLTIRNDVRQPHRKQKLWDNLVVTEKAMFRFQQVSKAVGIPQGKDFTSLEEFRLAVLYKPVRVVVKHEENEYMNEKRTQARIKAYLSATAEYNAPAESDPFGTTSNVQDALNFL